MSQSEQQRIAAQARSDYSRAQAARNNGGRALTPPALHPGAIIDPADGTLNKNYLENDLQVTIQRWENLPDNPDRAQTVFLQWAPAGEPYQDVGSLVITPPIDEDLFPIESLAVPKVLLQRDGPHNLRYRIRHYNGDYENSPVVSVIVDGTEPWPDQEPPPLLMPAGPITDETLQNNPDGIVAIIPDYARRQEGDWVIWWWSSLPIPEDPTQIEIAGQAPVTGTPPQFRVRTETIIENGDGGCFITYALMDKALNRSRIGVYTPMDVALGQLPNDLARPRVPLAEGDGLIDLMDANIGVVVEIPLYEGWKDKDRIKVTWGSTVLPAHEVGPNPDFPLMVRVPSAVLKSEYGDVVGGVSTTVSYQVLRGTVPFDSPTESVMVDFSYIGPPRPDPDETWPDPVNPNLGQLDTYGKASQLFNELTPEDKGLPAEQNILLYEGAKADDVIEFYWGGRLATTYVVQGFESPGEEIGVEVGWDIIEAVGNGPEVPVHYRIGAPGSPNQQHSQTYQVKVAAIVITPDAPQYLGRNEFTGWLTCGSLWEDPDNPHPLEPAVRVRVPDLTEYLSNGDTVTLTWTPYDRPEPGQGEIIESAVLRQEIILGGDTPATGFVWRVQPYEQYILPIYNPGGGSSDGRAETRYSFQLNGEPITSLADEEVVSMHNPSGPCQIPPGRLGLK